PRRRASNAGTTRAPCASRCGSRARPKRMVDEPLRRRWFRLRAGAANWLWVALAVIVLDQWTKYLIVTNLEQYDKIPVVPGIFDIVRYHNTGAAWSFLDDASGWQRWVFT